MSRYLRMVMLLLAGFFFMIPLLGRPLVARPMSPRMHGNHAANHAHQSFQTDDADPASPCTE
jgi:hypothetical protein